MFKSAETIFKMFRGNYEYEKGHASIRAMPCRARTIDWRSEMRNQFYLNRFALLWRHFTSEGSPSVQRSRSKGQRTTGTLLLFTAQWLRWWNHDCRHASLIPCFHDDVGGCMDHGSARSPQFHWNCWCSNWAKPTWYTCISSHLFVTDDEENSKGYTK